MALYRNILIPTDGSRESENAAVIAIRLGKALGSRITAVHIVPDTPSSGLEAWAHQGPGYSANLERTFENRAQLMLETIREIALRAGVPCECRIVRGGTPHEEILKVAAEQECDLIIMASHRLHSEPGVMLDGETIKVLSRGPVPVLVYH